MITVRTKNRTLLDAAIETLDAERPMTLRQLFYRLISSGHLANKPIEYNRLKALMSRAREDNTIPRTWIVDHVRETMKPSSWSGLEDFGETVRNAYRKDFWSTLPVHVEVLVEKDTIAGTIQPITNQYDVALRICRGYASISYAGEIA